MKPTRAILVSLYLILFIDWERSSESFMHTNKRFHVGTLTLAGVAQDAKGNRDRGVGDQSRIVQSRLSSIKTNVNVNIVDKVNKTKVMIPITETNSAEKRVQAPKRFSIDLGDDNNDSDNRLGFQNDNFKSGFVTIIGNPNVGKSTLLNTLLKEKLSIVSAKPQTTRHRILGVVTEKSYQVVFSDTPGMLKPSYKLQEAMMESVHGAANDADVIVLLTDVFGEKLADDSVLEKLQKSDRPIIIVINKVDMMQSSKHPSPAQTSIKMISLNASMTLPVKYNPALDNKRLNLKQRLKLRKSTSISNSNDVETTSFSSIGNIDQDSMDFILQTAMGTNSITKGVDGVELQQQPKTLSELSKYWSNVLPNADQLLISAQNRTGITDLMKKIVSSLPTGPKYFPDDQVTNRDERFFTTEIIRETILNFYKEEVPYSCEIVIGSFQDKTSNLSVIEALIIVNRASHKGILIGKAGNNLKEVGTVARQKLESFLDRKVFLSLKVRLDEDWRSNEDSLRKYGYIDSDFG